MTVGSVKAVPDPGFVAASQISDLALHHEQAPSFFNSLAGGICNLAKENTSLRRS